MGDLAERLARGDRAAFAELYDACADRLFGYLLRRLRSREDAQDVMQETFARLARARNKLIGVDNLTAYVFTIARRESLRLLNRREHAARATARLAADARESTADAERTSELCETIELALARLSSEQREIVDLKLIAGLTLREIAQITGWPPGTVATRYRTAIANLRTWLSQDYHA